MTHDHEPPDAIFGPPDLLHLSYVAFLVLHAPPRLTRKILILYPSTAHYGGATNVHALLYGEMLSSLLDIAGGMSDVTGLFWSRAVATSFRTPAFLSLLRLGSVERPLSEPSVTSRGRSDVRPGPVCWRCLQACWTGRRRRNIGICFVTSAIRLRETPHAFRLPFYLCPP